MEELCKFAAAPEIERTALALVPIVFGVWPWHRDRCKPDPPYWPDVVFCLALVWRSRSGSLQGTHHSHLAAAPPYPEGYGEFAVLLAAPLGGAQPPVPAVVRGAADLRARRLAERDFLALRGYLAWAPGPTGGTASADGRPGFSQKRPTSRWQGARSRRPCGHERHRGQRRRAARGRAA